VFSKYYEKILILSFSKTKKYYLQVIIDYYNYNFITINMKRKYQESYNAEILFDFFRERGISVDSIKKQVYGNDDFILPIGK